MPRTDPATYPNLSDVALLQSMLRSVRGYNNPSESILSAKEAIKSAINAYDGVSQEAGRENAKPLVKNALTHLAGRMEGTTHLILKAEEANRRFGFDLNLKEKLVTREDVVGLDENTGYRDLCASPFPEQGSPTPGTVTNSMSYGEALSTSQSQIAALR